MYCTEALAIKYRGQVVQVDIETVTLENITQRVCVIESYKAQEKSPKERVERRNQKGQGTRRWVSWQTCK
jgi:hypothetical protein